MWDLTYNVKLRQPCNYEASFSFTWQQKNRRWREAFKWNTTFPYLKSDFAFKRLSALHLYFHTLGYPRSRRLMKKETTIFWKNIRMFLNTQSLYQHFYVDKSFLCYPSSSWALFGEHKCILTYRENAWYAFCLKITWCIMCAMHEEFIAHFCFNSSLKGTAHRNCASLQAELGGPHCTRALHVGTCRPQTGGQLQYIFCAMRGLTSFRLYFPSHSKRWCYFFPPHTWNRAGPYGPPSSPLPCPLPAFCLQKNFSQE